MKKWCGIVFMFCMVFSLGVMNVSAQETANQELKTGYIYTDGQWTEIQRCSVGNVQEEVEPVASVSDNTVSEKSVSGNSTPAANQCGDTLYWNLDENGVMTISGTGDMWDFINDPNYFVYHECPWENRKTEIIKVKFESGITYVGAGAFMGCKNLKKVSFKDSITSIAPFAFMNCERLKNFELPKNLKILGQQAFDGCKKITKVVIPDTVYFLDGQIFHNASSLTDLYIGGSTDTPGYIYAEECIGLCTALEEIKVSPDNIALTAVDGVLYSKMLEVLVQYPHGKKDKKLVLPSNTKRVGQFTAEGALYLEEVVMPEGLKEVGVVAFRNMPRLKYLSYPSTITEVEEGNGAFCKEIVYIENKSETKIPLDMGYASFWADENDKQITVLGKGKVYKKGIACEVKVEDSTITLAVGDSMVLPVTIDYWNDEVRQNMEDLNLKSSKTKVATISESGVIKAKSVGTTKITIKSRYKSPNMDNSFEETCIVKVKKNIADAKVTGVKNQIYTGKEIKPTVKLTIGGEKLTKGKDYSVSYKNNKKIGTATVTIKGKGSYTGTIKKTFKIKVKKGAVYTVDKVTYKITNPKTNGSGTVTLKGVTNASKLKTLTVEKEVKIGGVKFKITAIGTKALKNCKKLKKVVIGENVKTIGKEAFCGDGKLKKIVIKTKKLKSVGKDAISGINAKTEILVPSAQVKDYKKLFKKSTGFKKTMKVVGK